jgi:hypothetical protein
MLLLFGFPFVDWQPVHASSEGISKGIKGPRNV